MKTLNELLEKEERLEQELLACNEYEHGTISKIKAKLNQINRDITTMCEV